MNVALPEDQLHIWVAYLPDHLTRLATLEALLAEDERKRAGKFRFERDRQAYIMSRGILRQLLARYLSQSASELVFNYGEQGKPMLKADLEFNLSHSHDYFALAVTLNTPVGVDIEWVNRTVVTDKLADTCFSPEELDAFQRMNAIEKQVNFFHGWTRKEAVIKALGCGLSFGLKNFSVSLQPDKPPKVVAMHVADLNASDWQLYSFLPTEAYCGAVAWQGAPKQIVLKTVERQ